MVTTVITSPSNHVTYADMTRNNVITATPVLIHQRTYPAKTIRCSHRQTYAIVLRNTRAMFCAKKVISTVMDPIWEAVCMRKNNVCIDNATVEKNKWNKKKPILMSISLLVAKFHKGVFRS